MKYRVVLTEQASRELERAAEWWAEHRDRQQAADWYSGFSERIWKLEENPESWPLADENDDFHYEIRELHFGLSSRSTHRAVYTIVGDIVLVLTIRHGAQDRISRADIEE
jgi:plasmid stabilization system protein ParE